MNDGWPKVLSRITTRISPWVDLIAREIRFAENGPLEIYHSVNSADYVLIFAVTPDGRIPLVTQYRPAIEAFTLELPSGLVDPGESPLNAARRELLEETGYPARRVHPIGIAAADAGRLSNRAHSFFIEAGERVPHFKPEDGVTTRLVTPAELVDLVLDGSFNVQVHLGTLIQAALGGHWTLPLRRDG